MRFNRWRGCAEECLQKLLAANHYTAITNFVMAVLILLSAV